MYTDMHTTQAETYRGLSRDLGQLRLDGRSLGSCIELHYVESNAVGGQRFLGHGAVGAVCLGEDQHVTIVEDAAVDVRSSK